MSESKWRWLEWLETRPGIWETTNGRYFILRSVLPETRRDRQPEVYHLRHVDEASARAHPGTLGYLLSEHWNLSDAKAEAERHAYGEAHATERSVPEDYPALALERFFWPISKGVTRAGLAVVRDSGRLVARVVGMARQEDPFVPVTYAEIDLTGLLAREGEQR